MFALVKTLKTAAHDPRIKGVLMKFDGPALSMAATMEVERRLWRLFPIVVALLRRFLFTGDGGVAFPARQQPRLLLIAAAT